VYKDALYAKLQAVSNAYRLIFVGLNYVNIALNACLALFLRVVLNVQATMPY
jgi:hypothetical protein